MHVAPLQSNAWRFCRYPLSERHIVAQDLPRVPLPVPVCFSFSHPFIRLGVGLRLGPVSLIQPFLLKRQIMMPAIAISLSYLCLHPPLSKAKEASFSRGRRLPPWLQIWPLFAYWVLCSRWKRPGLGFKWYSHSILGRPYFHTHGEEIMETIPNNKWPSE